ncbi:MAG: hypothetical protein M0P10_02265 [Sphaerochaetaceae bacterium]|jgi:hypothetical protein|nr:hypothetical protein [Sphaerochaetaceae bacterium]
MKKFLLTALVISAIAVSSLTAKTFTITLVAYVPEKVTFEQTDNGGYEVNSNSDSVDYGFYDSEGNSTDAYNASVFNVVAA